MRHYTSEYHRIPAIAFKKLIDAPLGKYRLNGNSISDDHLMFELAINSHKEKAILFTIKDKKIPIKLQLDNRSASNKLYLVCPYCNHQRQHMYAVSNAYACRKCVDLQYASQSERPMERLGRRIRKLRAALWGSDWPDTVNLLDSCEWWPKPKYLSNDKFIKQRDKISLLENKYAVLCAAQLEGWFGEEYSHLM